MHGWFIFSSVNLLSVHTFVQLQLIKIDSLINIDRFIYLVMLSNYWWLIHQLLMDWRMDDIYLMKVIMQYQAYPNHLFLIEQSYWLIGWSIGQSYWWIDWSFDLFHWIKLGYCLKKIIFLYILASSTL